MPSCCSLSAGAKSGAFMVAVGAAAAGMAKGTSFRAPEAI